MSQPLDPASTLFKLQPRWEASFPATAEASVSLSWSTESLELNFHIKEPQIRALETDPWLVHRDSCAEFFINIPGSSDYLNIEVNPVGLLLIARGAGRENRRDLTDELKMYISMEGDYYGRESFDAPGDSWYLNLRIHPRLIGQASWDSVSGYFCNIYKCGDGLSEPHYLSLAPLSSDQPDFHRPRDFVKLTMENL